jgi:hypothetical protein
MLSPMRDRPAHESASRRALLGALASLALLAAGCALDRAGLGVPVADGGGARLDAGDPALDSGSLPGDGGEAALDAAPLTDAGDAGEVIVPPGPPGRPTFSGIAARSVRVSWIAPTVGGPVSGYDVERALTAAGPFTTVAAGIPGTTADDRGLEPATTYHYRVRASGPGGAGPFSETADVRTADDVLPPITVARVQWRQNQSTNPSITLDATPTPGNLLVSMSFHRNDEATPSMAAGWEQRVYSYYRTDSGNRRALTVWTRIAGADEPRSVQVTWSPSRDARLVVMELSAAGATGWSHAASTHRTSEGSSVTVLSSGETTPQPAADYAVIGAFGSRDSPGSTPVFSGMGPAVGQADSITLFGAFGQNGEGGALSTQVTWPTSRMASAALVAFRLTR